MENTNVTETTKANGITYKLHGNGSASGFCAEYRKDEAKTKRFNILRVNGKNVGTREECEAAIQAHKDSQGFQPDEQANAEFYAGLRN